ncbi:MAG: redox-sensing transcriptional repressor Rex, partial [Candidatus Omnitrophica bacterium]|nr:redox-sensing transcriptional repressor Rex [Candidatus Omnitrophota bacterium]
TDTAKHEEETDIPILPLERMQDFVKQQQIKVGIIAVPDMAAQHVADLMAYAGIKGILNFAPIRLRVAEACIINNVNLEIELENLIYFVKVVEPVKQ